MRVLVVLALLVLAHGEPSRFDGMSLYEVHSSSGTGPLGCEEWKRTASGVWLACVQGVVPAGVVRVVHADIGAAMALTRDDRRRQVPSFFGAFRSFSEIVTQLQTWVTAYGSARNVTLTQAGSTLEGNPLWLFRIPAQVASPATAPAMLSAFGPLSVAWQRFFSFD